MDDIDYEVLELVSKLAFGSLCLAIHYANQCLTTQTDRQTDKQTDTATATATVTVTATATATATATEM